MKTLIHNKDFAQRLAFKEALVNTEIACCSVTRRYRQVKQPITFVIIPTKKREITVIHPYF